MRGQETSIKKIPFYQNRAKMASYTTLPPEIRSKIIASISDAAEVPRAWLVYRLVSRSFRQDVEEAFRTHYLKRVQIHYKLYNLAKFGPMDLVFEFARLCENGERAVFRPVAEDPEGGRQLSSMTVLRRREDDEEWRWEQMRLWRRLFRSDPWYLTSLPPHAIALDASVMDTGLPGFQVDYEAPEISFLWKPMWDGFLGELAWMQRAERDQEAIGVGGDGGGGDGVVAVDVEAVQQQPRRKHAARIWEHRAREIRLGRAWKGFMGEDFAKADYDSFAWEDQVKRVELLESLRTAAASIADLQALGGQDGRVGA
jgi:hypothetical protein